MADTRHVYAVPGSMIDRPGQRGDYIGYERVWDASAPCDHAVPNGFRYVVKPDGEHAPENVDIRRAVKADTNGLFDPTSDFRSSWDWTLTDDALAAKHRAYPFAVAAARRALNAPAPASEEHSAALPSAGETDISSHGKSAASEG